MQQPNNDKKPGLSWSTPPTSNTNPKPQTSTPLTLPKMNPNNGNVMARYAGIFVGGLIVGVVFAWGWSAIAHKSNTTATNSTSTIATTNSASTTSAKASTVTKPSGSTNASVASGVVLQSAELTVASTQIAGQSVKVDAVTVSKPIWVVVYDNNNGKPGNVLGAQLFFATGAGTVTLLRPTIAGKTYVVGRAIDNGDHKFQKATDQIVMDENGNPVLVTFTAK